MTTAEDEPVRKQESQATESPGYSAETPTRLQQAGAGIASAQAWKGQRNAMGWRKVVNAISRHREEG